MSLLKKIITVMLIATMILSMSSFAVSALTEETAKQDLTLSQDIPDEDSLPSSDEMLMGYLEKDIYPPISLFGRSAYDLLNEYEKILYNKIKENIIKIANGEKTSTAIEITSGLDDFRWTTEELGVSQLISGGKITDAANTAISNAIKSMITTGDIMRALMTDVPCELFWFDKTEGMQTSYASYAQNSEAWVTKFIFYFDVSSDFAGNSSYTTNTTRISAINTAKTTAQSIVDSYEDKTDIEKLTAYKEKICELTDYYSGNINGIAYGNPWQLIWVFDNDPATDVVCEGYSKAFKYLCDLSEFSSSVYCYLVTGNMYTQNVSGPHMWNIVEIGGKNYFVDVTNSDSGSIGQEGQLFMVGVITSYGGAVNQISGVATYEYDSINIGNFIDDGVYIPVSETSYAYDSIRTYTVTVNGGVGGGEYSEGATVTVTADEPGENQIFEGWVVTEGDFTLSDAESQSVTFTMPKHAVTLTATYHTHTFSTDFSYDGEQHWFAYTCGCTEKHLLASHEYEENTVEEASCTAPGKIEYVCECGHTYEIETDILDHEYDDGEITKEPSTDEVGEKKFSCKNCEHFFLEEIEKLPPVQEQPEVGDDDESAETIQPEEDNETVIPEADGTGSNVNGGSANENNNLEDIKQEQQETDKQTNSESESESKIESEDTSDKFGDADNTEVIVVDDFGCASSISTISTSILTTVCILGCALIKRKEQ